MKNQKNIFIFIFSIISTLSLPATAHLLFMAEGGRAEVDGFSQIPRGGDPGSSTIRRPNFEEMGKRHANIYTLGIGLEYTDYQLWYKSTPLRFEQITTLTQTLNTHGQTIDTGDYFKLRMETNWQAVILEKKICADFDALTIIPYIEFDYIKYIYFFTRIDGAGSTRSFANIAGRLGIKLDYRLNALLSVNFQGATTLPFSHLTLTNANLNLKIHLLEQRYAVSTPYIGLGYIHLDSIDKQALPNHLRYTAKPYVYTGIEIALI